MTHLFFYKYSDIFGGIQEIIRELSRYLDEERGDGVIIISDHESYRDVLCKQYKHFDVYYLRAMVLLKIIFSKSFHTVSFFEPYPKYVYLASLFKRTRGSVVTNMVFCGSRSEEIHGVSKFILKKKSNLFDNYLAISDYVRLCVSKQTGLGDIHLVYAPVDIQKFKRSKLNNKRLITIGRISPRKNYLDLVKVIEMLVRKDKSITLDIIGGLENLHRPYYLELKQMIAKYDLQKNIRIFIDASERQKIDLLAGSTLYLTTSRHEMLGISTIEAFASGLPVVGYDNTANSEVINLGGGVVVSDPKSMTQVTWELLANRDKMEELGTRSYRAARQFATKNVCSRYASLISLSRGNR